jgi:hypothetical protein
MVMAARMINQGRLSASLKFGESDRTQSRYGTRGGSRWVCAADVAYHDISELLIEY